MTWFRNNNNSHVDMGSLSAHEQDELLLSEGDGHADEVKPFVRTPESVSIPQLEEENSAAEVDEWYLTLKRRLHQQVMSGIEVSRLRSRSDVELRDEFLHKARVICGQDPDLSELPEQGELIEEFVSEVTGYGPISGVMTDSEISDILINGPRQVFVEKRGQLYGTKVAFHDEEHLSHILERIVAATGRHIDENSPMVDARLPDGSRLNAVIRPLALNGPLVSIRRFGTRPLTADDLWKNGSVTQEMLDFLAACVRARINIIISGGAGSGKTTLLNCLSRYIPQSERLTTIEDAAELMLQQPHVAKMETRPANGAGRENVTMRDLVRNALRMRPDRIIVGECRGPEALDMLQSMNSGHEGSLTTIHANTPRDAVARLEIMIGSAGYDLPVWVIRKQIAAAVQIVVQIARLPGGQRKILKISEITGLQDEVVMMHDIFEFVQTGVGDDQAAIGYFQTTGVRPDCQPKLIANGIHLPKKMFAPRRLYTFQDQALMG